MHAVVVIDMQNSNALISMALVSQNANNPYSVFCEYIKYCIFSNDKDILTLAEIRQDVMTEFGLALPYHIEINCLRKIALEGHIIMQDNQIKRTGEFDIDGFDQKRVEYRSYEEALINQLLDYARKYNKEWTYEHAREQLIKVLDKNGLAYNIFINGQSAFNAKNIANDIMENQELLLENSDDEADSDDGTDSDSKQPMYHDSFFVGKFIQQILSTNSVYKNYLQSVCEGLMLCVGAYQLPDADTKPAVVQIKGTQFFFDTKLLLRVVGCAGEAAVEASCELVKLIQNAGGIICYYPQTLKEIQRAFEDAICSLSNGYLPHDDEMRLYSSKINNNTEILKSKKASIEKELGSKKIYIRQRDTFSENERLQFGFDRIDLQKFMESTLKWEQQTIENDAWSLWETHMRRHGDYSEYCGTNKHLHVFVTTNSRLISIALQYREKRENTKTISDWKQNRLPVITDMQLTCRLWLPGAQSERLSLLYLTANAVAAQRPTKRYLNAIRNFAIETRENVPEYSSIPLTSYFDDNLTDIILETTHGLEDNFNIENFSNSLEELSERKLREEKKLRNQEITKSKNLQAELDTQTQAIIESAVARFRHKLLLYNLILRIIQLWGGILSVLLAGISGAVSQIPNSCQTSGVALAISAPMLITLFEHISQSYFVKKRILRVVIPKLEVSLDKHIEKKLSIAEKPHKNQIINRIKATNPLWVKYTELIC